MNASTPFQRIALIAKPDDIEHLRPTLISVERFLLGRQLQVSYDENAARVLGHDNGLPLSELAEHADLAQIMFDGFQDLTKLDGVDRVRFYTTAHNLFLGYENIYFQYQDGALDPRHWKGISQHMVDASKVAGLLTYWEERKHWFTDEFRDYWENRVLPAPANTNYRLMGT